MNARPAPLDLQRERWRRARETFGLADPGSEEFATGGIPRLAGDIGVRLLILPSDPEACLIEFDQELWDWWLKDRPDPSDGQPTLWGDQHRPTAHAAVRFRGYGRESWMRYIALHRHGGLEVGLGRDGVYQGGDRRVFRLLQIVGRAWSTLDLYREVIERFGVEGPWELSLALQGTAGAYLGDLATGWLEPGQDALHEPRRCVEPGLLLLREITDWPDTGGARHVAFSLGGQIEDAWGSRYRRFIAHDGGLGGQFDTEHYRWD